MKTYLHNRWIILGLALVVFGWGPLAAVILLSAVGLWPYPDANPVGPGLLCLFTGWPAIGCLATGVLQVTHGRT